MKCLVYLSVLLFGFVLLPKSEADLRRHGEPYPGLQNQDVRPNPKLKAALSKKDSRILGGEVTALGAAPWQVSMQNQYGNHFCNGVIIHQQYVLTAASCVAGLQNRNIYIITGTNDWMGEAIYYTVEDVFIHCNFDKPLYHNDIALVKLAQLIAWDEVTQNVTIAELDELVEGETLTLYSWGSWELGGDYWNDLKELKVTYVPYEKCRQTYRNSDDVDIAHVCAVAPVNEGACHGDTGSPLFNADGVLVGINNWGIPCGHGFPDVYARLSFYNDWIRTTIEGCQKAE